MRNLHQLRSVTIMVFVYLLLVNLNVTVLPALMVPDVKGVGLRKIVISGHALNFIFHWPFGLVKNYF